MQRGFSQVSWQCRFEIASRQPALVLDSAHNQESFERLAQTLAEVFPGKKIILVFGVSEDKDMPAMLATLQGRLEMVLATCADHPRAVDPQAIVAAAASLGIPAEAASPPAAALERALLLAVQGGQVVVSAGSMFVTAEVKTAWQKLNQGRGGNPR
jgi:dihydrofolate synthase/folylpolyglutamate synthase